MELGKIMLDKREIDSQREMSEFEVCLLHGLWNELERVYWNEYQEEFNNYGSSEDTKDIFPNVKWCSYDWSYEPKNTPNFSINGKNFWFYKYFGRSMTTDSEEELNRDWYHDSLEIIRKSEKDLY